MRVKKTHSVYKQQLKLEFPLFTEPNQSFTPRQIIDQFSRGELSAKSFEPSDSIADDIYSDDHMVDYAIEFEDEFAALEFMKTTKVKRNNKKDDSGRQESAKEVTDKVKRNNKDDNGRQESAKEGTDKASEGSGAEKA